DKGGLAVEIITPKVTIPPHLVYQVDVPVGDQARKQIYYCLIAPTERIAEAEHVLQTQGAAAFLDTYTNGLWFNRHPYEFYHLLTRVKKSIFVNDSYFPDSDTSWVLLVLF